MDRPEPIGTVLPLDEVTGAIEALTEIFESEDDFELLLRQVCRQELYTTAVEAVLRTYDRYLDAREATEQLRTVLTSRTVIDQAKGVLMAARQIDADEAFGMLGAQSQRENVKLRQVAERFIANVTGKPWAGRTERGAR
jgi:hypothetical protein